MPSRPLLCVMPRAHDASQARDQLLASGMDSFPQGPRRHRDLGGGELPLTLSFCSPNLWLVKSLGAFYLYNMPKFPRRSPHHVCVHVMWQESLMRCHLAGRNERDWGSVITSCGGRVTNWCPCRQHTTAPGSKGWRDRSVRWEKRCTMMMAGPIINTERAPKRKLNQGSNPEAPPLPRHDLEASLFPRVVSYKSRSLPASAAPSIRKWRESGRRMR